MSEYFSSINSPAKALTQHTPIRIKSLACLCVYIYGFGLCMFVCVCVCTILIQLFEGKHTERERMRENNTILCSLFCGSAALSHCHSHAPRRQKSRSSHLTFPCLPLPAPVYLLRRSSAQRAIAPLRRMHGIKQNA